MTVILGILQLIIIGCIAFYEYTKRSMSVFLWAVLLLMYGLPNVLDCIFGAAKVSDTVLVKANLFVIGFSLVYLLTRIILVRKRRVLVELNFLEELPKKQIRFYLILISMALFIYLTYVYKTTGSIWGSTWNTIRAKKLSEEGHIYGNSNLLYIFYSFSGDTFLAISGLLTYALCKKIKTLWMVIISFFLIHAFISRTRTGLLPILIPLLLFLVFKNSQLNLRLILRIILLSVLSIFMIYFLQVIRLAGSIEVFFKNFSFGYISRMIGELISSSSGDLSLRNVFYFFVENDNNFFGFGTLASYRGLLLLPFPSQITFGLKPPDFAITMGGALLGDFSNISFSTHPTLFGDCYANFGYFGVLIGIFWAFLISVLDKCVCKTNFQNDRLMYITIICSQYVMIARGSVYYGCRSLLVASAIVWICRHFVFRLHIKCSRINNEFGNNKI